MLTKRCRMPYLGAMRRIYFVAFLLIVSCHAHAQQYFFQSFGTEEGIPVSTINDIAEDPLGFMWIATEGGGLAQFDGLKSEVYTVDDGLPSNYVTALLYTEQYGLLIGSDKGLTKYDGYTFENLAGIGTDRIVAITEMNGSIVIVQRRGVIILAPDGSIEEIFVPGNPELMSAAFDEHLYIGSSDGLWKRVGDEWAKWWDGKNVRSIFLTPDNDGTVQVGAEDNVYLILRQNLAVANLNTSENSTPHPDVRDIVHDEQGRWWYGSYLDGLRRYDANKPEGSRGIAIGTEEGLNTPKIRCLHVSSDGRIWIGGLTGLSRLVEPDLYKYTVSNGLADNRVHAIFSDENSWWIGGLNSLTRRDKKGEMTSYGLQEGLPRGLVFDIDKTVEGTLYVATENGLATLSGSRFKTYGEDDGLGNAFIFDLEPLADGGLGVATTTGIYRFQNGRFTIVDQNLISTAITRIRQDATGALWAMDLEGRIMKRQDDKWSYAFAEEDMLRVSPSTFEITPNGVLWMGTNGNGLWRLENGKLDSISQSEGLISDNVWSLSVVENDIWIGTELGIQNLSWDNGWTLGTRVTEARGFGSMECNPHAVIRAKGSVLFGTNSGLLVAPTAELGNGRNAGKIALVKLDLYFEQPGSWDEYAESITAWSGMPMGLDLPYDQNYLRFSYSALNIADPRALQYAYRLTPLTSDWTQVEDRTEANYTSVPPGKYTFETRAFDPLSGKTLYSEPYSFVIRSPFWKRWWFYVLLVLVIGGSIAIYIKLRIKRIQDRLALEEERNDLERRALRLQMNPHFVFNALDAISGFIFKNEPKEAVQYLNNFAKLMRLMLESSREHVIPIHTEIQLLKNYLALEQLRFSGSFESEIIVDEELDLYGQSMPSMMVQPHVENAILHGLRPQGKGKVTIHFEASDSSIRCIVEDDGVGRKRSAEIREQSGRKHRSLAGEISRRRVELFEKTFGGKSAVMTEDLYDDNGDPRGTRVTIHLPLQSTDDWEDE